MIASISKPTWGKRMSARTAILLLTAFLSTNAIVANANPSVEVVTRSDFELVPLNPLRGDASPKAGVLWGDLRRDVPTGALIQFADGFASPPHIHNITYRAVVIDGTVHNDDPNAESLWMGPGSFWTQPAGEVHITAVGPGGGTAFLEILSGPYLVQPLIDAFDNGERPVNIEESNVVWLDAEDIKWVDHASGSAGPEVSFLWGSPRDGEINGTFVKLPSDYSGRLVTNGEETKAVLITGLLKHGAGDLAQERSLEVGSYFGSEGEVEHELTCESEEECIIYIRTTGTYRIVDKH